MSFAQIGGRHSFEFLNVPVSARLAALGGVNVSEAGRDVTLFMTNPSLLTDTLEDRASAGYQFYVADAGQAVFSYAHKFHKLGLMGFGVQHMGYGTLDGYDASGTSTGEFNAAETALVIGKSYQAGNFQFGGNVKAVFSSIGPYRANAFMVDLGGVFIHPDLALTVGVCISNLGFVGQSYTGAESTSLPFDVRLGTTFQPEHMPVRFSVTAWNLTTDQVVYYDDTDENDEPGVLDKVLSRLNFGAELLLHQHVAVLVGYNYLLHKELKLTSAGGGAGFSAGVAARIKAFEFTVSRNSYIVGTAGYSLTLAADLKNRLIRH